ncbi:MAG: hypothetical protein AAB968_01355, partial [Patescibacteria group bacterium]
RKCASNVPQKQTLKKDIDIRDSINIFEIPKQISDLKDACLLDDTFDNDLLAGLSDEDKEKEVVKKPPTPYKGRMTNKENSAQKAI